MQHRVEHMTEKIQQLLQVWPKVMFRQVSQFLGQLNSMHPVLEGRAMICAKNLQTIVIIRHFRDLSWEKVIVSDYEPLFEHAKKELIF
jgi:hypothetical protein